MLDLDALRKRMDEMPEPTQEWWDEFNERCAVREKEIRSKWSPWKRLTYDSGFYHYAKKVWFALRNKEFDNLVDF